MKKIEIELLPETVALLKELRKWFPGKTDEEVIRSAIDAGLELAGIPHHANSIAVHKA